MYVLYSILYMQWPLEVHGINIVSEISPYGQTINRHQSIRNNDAVYKNLFALQCIIHEKHYSIVLVSYQMG